MMPMPRCELDHLAITSPTLEAGSDLVYACLGVRPQRGGEHPRMGTHNLLLRLGEATYLEVIAVDPQATRPPRPRWFALDSLPADAAPRLACWVARTDDIHTSLATASEALGRAEAMSRGSLHWLISIPEDGSLPLAGVAPTLIQWQDATHPAVNLPDLGCSLEALAVLHPEPQRIGALLSSLGFAAGSTQVSVLESAEAGLAARIRTPSGWRTLGIPGAFASDGR
ncbi:MAG TPA: VOC family protein [Burkholderiaceae bacterium]|nr:VOC family protein [Burkholderiaceae bacterium]